mmetsp:Transcript_8848/g.21540  ORF Transcript_8848/g.21540 Transcript_8848/m.21540 type:complete len:737 (-) Transcript_8848:294-2504(-)|eukprot:CAMPEP_0179006322 /NCGR_PEP_ID=MMETSP0795-20121207/14478_1 /TAXON_ID=88552 /ORGANISM="Amoebophrya sp., Strain Ameob2" /LENGTH=736 /DNA_ID=CAMNT_0020701047 /DNA_START=498 /DNA_END=2708 /DNA_ORIENTATION=-
MPAQDSINLLENAELIKDLRRRNRGMGETLRECRHVCCFIIFLGLFTGLIMIESFANFYSFEKSIRDKFDNVSGTGADAQRIQLSDVETIDHLWHYINTTFYENVYYDSTTPNSTYEILKLDQNHYNLLTGKIRFRVVRVQEGTGCQLSSSYSMFEPCYGGYSVATEATTDYGENPEEQFTHETADGFEYSGIAATYSPNGYVNTLSTDYAEAQTKLNTWKHDGYFDVATRAIFIDFNVYSVNLDYYGATKLVFEITPSGKMVNRLDFTVVTERYIQPNFNAQMICEMVLLLFAAYYIAQELSEFSISKSEYMQDGWNIMDWANLILLIVYAIFRVLAFSAGGGDVDAKAIADQSVFADMNEFAYYIKEMRAYNAYNAVLIWVKTVKYVTFIPYVTIMMHTLKYSWKFFVSFSVIFLSIFLGFSVGFVGGFGDKFEKVNSFGKASLFLLQSFVGSASFGPMFALSPILAGVLIGMFIILIFFILLNLFMAIMVVALSEAKSQAVQDEDDAWSKFKQKLANVTAVVKEHLSLDEHIEYWLPGLHHRRRLAKQARLDLLRRRQERKNALDMRKRIALGRSALYDEGEDDGGPESPTAGRVKLQKAKRGSGADDHGFAGIGSSTALPLTMPLETKSADEFSESDDSEVDIGILSSSKAKLRKKKQATGGVTESELILQSVQHITALLARRTETVKVLLLQEMQDVKTICHVVSDVLEILARRGSDLSKQQATFIESLGF